LKRAIAKRFDVALENITTGCGSDDLIDSAIRAFCEPGDKFAFPSPTFGVVSTFARMNATKPTPVPSNERFEVDVEKLIGAGGAVTYVCSPNNPTGTVVEREKIERLDARLDGVLLLDEAYADFSETDYAQFAARSSRTVSLRTMSKVYGLAGLRVGYAIGPTDVILEIEKSRGPYKVGGPAEVAASRAIGENEDWRRDVVRKTVQNRTRLAGEIDKRGLKQIASAANFILILLPPGQDAVAANNELRKYGVSTRPFSGLPHVGECLRVTIGPWEMMEKFLNALDGVIGR